jgi:hypothetical protein
VRGLRPARPPPQLREVAGGAVITMQTLSIFEWAARCIEASYPSWQRQQIAEAVDAYLAWLDSLPTTQEVPMTSR